MSYDFTGGMKYTRVYKPPEPDPAADELKKLRAAEDEADSVRRNARLIPRYEMTSTAYVYTELEMKISDKEQQIQALRSAIRNFQEFHPSKVAPPELEHELERRQQQLAALKAQQEQKE